MVPRHDAHVVKLRLMVGLCDGWMGLIACPLITMIVLWGAADIVRYPPPSRALMPRRTPMKLWQGCMIRRTTGEIPAAGANGGDR